MRLIIFADNDGCARSIRGNCVQPVVGGSSAMSIDRAQSNSIYTAVMEVYMCGVEHTCHTGWVSGNGSDCNL